MTGVPPTLPVGHPMTRPPDETTLVDVLDRVLDRGVVLEGDLLLGVAGVDLVHVGLRLIIRSVDGPTSV